MATTQELLDKLKSNLTSIYDKLESKGVQVSGNKNLDNLVLAIDNVGGGGGITEIATPEEMEAFKTEANVGKYAKYVGETTDTYVNGAIYLVEQKGGNIALFDESTLMDGQGYVVTSDTSLETTFANEEAVNINFTINSGEVKTFASTWIEQDGMTMIGVDSGNPQTIYQDDSLMIMFMGYCNMNIMSSAQGQTYMCIPVSVSNGAITSDIVEVVSFSNATSEVVNPLSYLYKSYIYLPNSASTIASENNIKDGYSAYNEKGELLMGKLKNPEEITSQEEYDNVINNSDTFNEVYKVTADVANINGLGGLFIHKRLNNYASLQNLISIEDIAGLGSIGFYNTKVVLLDQSFSRPYAYAYSTNLKIVEFVYQDFIYLAHHLFYGCDQLTTIIIRGENSVSRGGEGMFDETPIANGSGYIYVPDSLVEDYKVENYWSTYASQIKPLSEYVEE